MRPLSALGEQAAASAVTDLVSGEDLDGWHVVLAVAAVAAGWILGRLAERTVRRMLARVQGINEDLRQLAARVTKYFTWMLGLGIALSFLGASVQPVLATSLLVCAVAVLALRGIADNFAAGVVIQTRRPIQLGDEVEVLGHLGTVQVINGRSVVLETSDGTVVHVPNSKVLQNPLVNNSVVAHRRSDIEVRTAWTDDIAELQDVIARSLDGLDELLAEPAPSVRVTGTDPARITLLVRVWHPPSRQAPATSSGVIAIAIALRGRNIDATVIAPPPDAPLTPPPPI